MRIAQRVIDSREFSEWLAYDRISPIRPLEDLFVILAQANWLFAEANRDRKRKPTGYDLKQFLPMFLRPPERQAEGDPEILWQKMQMIAAMWDD
ncbi:MAG: hypothetical protein WAS33_07405 [Candidatus Promineifilaceae bacterium]